MKIIYKITRVKNGEKEVYYIGRSGASFVKGKNMYGNVLFYSWNNAYTANKYMSNNYTREVDWGRDVQIEKLVYDKSTNEEGQSCLNVVDRKVVYKDSSYLDENGCWDRNVEVNEFKR